MAAVKDGVGELLIYGAIGSGWWSDGHTPASVQTAIEQLKAQGAKSLKVYIHSLGGSAVDGFGIYSVLKRFDGQKTICVEGIAASAASVILMAGDTVQMGRTSMVMVHEASNMCFGTATDMRNEANALDSVTASAIAAYVSKTKQPEAEIKKLLADETWMTAEQALDRGFCDEILEYEDDEEDDDENGEQMSVESAFLRQYKRVPPSAHAMLVRGASKLSTKPVSPAQPQESDVTFDEYRKQAEADANTIADLKARVGSAEKAKTDAEKPIADLLAATGKQTAAEALAVVAALKESSAQVSALQAEIAKRDEAAAKQAKEREAAEIKALLDEAGKDGRLTPAKRKEIDEGSNEGLKTIAASPVTLRAYLESLPKVAMTATDKKPEEVANAKAPPTVTLTDEDKKVIEATGSDPVLFALAKADPSGALMREEQENRKKAALAAAKK